MHEPFKSLSSDQYRFVNLIERSPTDFQRYMFWGRVSRVQVLKVGVPGVGFKPFASHGGEAPGFEFSGRNTWGRGFITRTCFSLSYLLPGELLILARC